MLIHWIWISKRILFYFILNWKSTTSEPQHQKEQTLQKLEEDSTAKNKTITEPQLLHCKEKQEIKNHSRRQSSTMQ